MEKVFNGKLNDILKSINPDAKFFASSEQIAKNRVIVPLLQDEQDELKKYLFSTIEETFNMIQNSRNLDKDEINYLNGVKESLNILKKYLKEKQDLYDLIGNLTDLANAIEIVYNSILRSEKPYYAGLFSALINFVDVLQNRIREAEVSRFDLKERKSLTR